MDLDNVRQMMTSAEQNLVLLESLIPASEKLYVWSYDQDGRFIAIFLATLQPIDEASNAILMLMPYMAAMFTATSNDDKYSVASVTVVTDGALTITPFSALTSNESVLRLEYITA